MGIMWMILAMLWGAISWAISMASMVIGMLGFWALSILGISYLIYKVAGNRPDEKAIGFKKKPRPLQESRAQSLKGGSSPVVERLTCPHCGQRLHEDDVICPGCYRDLQTNCPSCGEIVDINWDFCPRCGKTVHKLTA